MKPYALLSFYLLCVGLCFGADIGVIDPKAVPVALVHLLESPQKHNGEKVYVMGACFWEREGSFLFLTREHCQAYDTESAIALAVDAKLLPASLQELAKLQGRFVAIEGVFNSTGGVGGRAIISPVTRVLLRDKTGSDKQSEKQ
jgi:hypothetical protein